MEKHAKDDIIIGKTCKRKIPLIIREDDICYNLYSKTDKTDSKYISAK